MEASKSVEYSELEEKWNIRTHGLGLILSIIGSVLLIKKAFGTSNTALCSAIIFSVSMIVLYLASTLYHASTHPKIRGRFRIWDHAAIYLLIAGTYTPFLLLSIGGTKGWIYFSGMWLFALIGVSIKLFFTGRFNKISTIVYVVMGWSIIGEIGTVIDAISWPGFYWLLAGGLSYSIGAIFYLFDKLPLNHAIFHVWVLGGTICHFWVVYQYVI